MSDRDDSNLAPSFTTSAVLESASLNSERLVCHFINATNSLQAIEVWHSSVRLLQRVVFPGERLLFEAPAQATLEVRTRNSSPLRSTNIPSRTLACQSPSLRFHED